MTTYKATKVRKVRAKRGTHVHVEGVYTDGGGYFTRRQVVKSLNAGDVWEATSPKGRSKIVVTPFCPSANCLVSPYLKVKPNGGDPVDLESLPEC